MWCNVVVFRTLIPASSERRTAAITPCLTGGRPRRLPWARARANASAFPRRGQRFHPWPSSLRGKRAHQSLPTLSFRAESLAKNQNLIDKSAPLCQGAEQDQPQVVHADGPAQQSSRFLVSLSPKPQDAILTAPFASSTK